MAQKRAFSFAYDQPPTTAYGIAANIFDAKLKELSGGNSASTSSRARSSTRNHRCCKLRAGDIDFVIIRPPMRRRWRLQQAGVFSLHFIPRRAHLAKVTTRR
jgi:hypothetical protein